VVAAASVVVAARARTRRKPRSRVLAVAAMMVFLVSWLRRNRMVLVETGVQPAGF
jgi:hypothetical protein